MNPSEREFSRRARLYAGLDRRWAERTRFFGAASLTNAVLAELFSQFGSRWYVARGTADFLLHLGAQLERLNLAQIESLHKVATCIPMQGSDADIALIALEQSAVQWHLEGLRRCDGLNHRRAVAQIDRMLAFGASKRAPTRSFAAAAAYARVLRVVGAELGRSISFAHQRDRERIGLTLIQLLRAGAAVS